MGSVDETLAVDQELDVIIIGAGASGINAAYRVQTQLPNHSYTIFESRDAIGGTWDFFRYPGVRSDSDLHTFGFPWNPWTEKEAFAHGSRILRYVNESARKFGIDEKVQYRHKLLAADWSSSEQKWILSVDVSGQKQTFKSRFIFMSTGYYDYKEPLKSSIPGIDSFLGEVVHPQSWPQDLDYTNKKMIIIGSGATAVTLLPNLAKKAQSVTMLQRSPAFFVSVASSGSGAWIRRLFPFNLANTLIRWEHIIVHFLFYQICRAFPRFMRLILKMGIAAQLPSRIPHDPHFRPSYEPWDQRVCVTPDGDFFEALRDGKGHIVTDNIQTVNEKGIVTSSGEFLEADIIVTATGLKLLAAGGARVSIDGTTLSFGDKFLWNGGLLQDVPNAAYILGYINTAWTLGSDATAVLFCRLLKHMEENQLSVAVPRLGADHNMRTGSAFTLKSSYILKSEGIIPQAGDRTPWRPRDNSVRDIWHAHNGSVTQEMEFTKMGEAKKTR